MPDTYLSVPIIAARLGVNVNKVLAWIGTGELAAVDLSARRGKRPRWRIASSDLEKFLAARRAVPAVKVERQRRRANFVEYV